MLAIMDYDMGNLKSVQAGLIHLGAQDYYVASKPEELQRADAIILPGVGAFGAASQKLKETGLFGALQKRIQDGTPFLGICLGMHLLFEKGLEGGEHEGLGAFSGAITRFDIEEKVPHMGWNAIEKRLDCPLFEGLPDAPYAYFAHSYHAADTEADYAAGITEYGRRFVSVAWKDNVYATQFHPEKSGKSGLRMLENFLRKAGILC